jgi:hypothetical protein
MEMFNVDQYTLDEKQDNSFYFENMFYHEYEIFDNQEFEFNFEIENESKSEIESEFIIQEENCSKYENQILEIFHQKNTQQKRSSSLPLESKMILLKWLEDHKDNPYPSTFEFELLMNKSQLSRKQIKIFLVNHRSRFLNRHPNKDKNN